MARTNWNPEVGPLPANKGGKHGGIDPAAGRCDESFAVEPTETSSGHPGTQNPWEGANSTAVGANTQVPALKNLGTPGSGFGSGNLGQGKGTFPWDDAAGNSASPPSPPPGYLDVRKGGHDDPESHS